MPVFLAAANDLASKLHQYLEIRWQRPFCLALFSAVWRLWTVGQAAGPFQRLHRQERVAAPRMQVPRSTAGDGMETRSL